MVCLGFEPVTAVWEEQTDPLSFGGPPIEYIFDLRPFDGTEMTFSPYLMTNLSASQQENKKAVSQMIDEESNAGMHTYISTFTIR